MDYTKLTLNKCHLLSSSSLLLSSLTRLDNQEHYRIPSHSTWPLKMGLRQEKQYGDNNPILYNQSTGLGHIFSTDSQFKVLYCIRILFGPTRSFSCPNKSTKPWSLYSFRNFDGIQSDITISLSWNKRGKCNFLRQRVAFITFSQQWLFCAVKQPFD